MIGLAETSAPLVFPLDGDDLRRARRARREMADRLDATPDAAACVGDLLEFGDREVLRAVPERLDPYRVAYTNEYPITAALPPRPARGGRRLAPPPRPSSRATRTGACGWTSPSAAGRSRTSARAASATAAGSTAAASTTRRASTTARSTARCARRIPQLFADLPEHRRRSDLSGVRKILYPVVYGERARVPFEDVLKPIADRFGIWTLTRR